MRPRSAQERKIAGVFAGDPVKAHAAGVEFVERACLEEIDEPGDVVITSAAGFPLDLTFYQTIKGLIAMLAAAPMGYVTGQNIVSDGGTYQGVF